MKTNFALSILFALAFSLNLFATEKDKNPSRFNKNLETDKLFLNQLFIDENIRPWGTSSTINKTDVLNFENPSISTTTLVLNTYKPDNRYTYHPEYSSKIGDSESFINFFPAFERPKQINLRLMDMFGENVTVEITSQSGLVVFSKIFSLSSDLNLISIDLAKALYGRGVYEISIKSKEIWEGFIFQY